MCGIFGEFITYPGGVSRPTLFTYLNELNFRRGPDSGEIWTDFSHFQAGFRRLAIQDLRAEANQPMVSHNGNWVMVFNGEIYNHQEIRKQLPSDKFQFRSHGDSETLICAFEHWGPEETVKKLDGMFAIGLYNKRERLLYLMRDFAGIKPLFYGYAPEGWVFGSQYDQIILHPFLKDVTINPDALFCYLQYHYLPAPLGLHYQTGQLRPGEILRVGLKGESYSQIYYQLPEEPNFTISNHKQAIEVISGSLQDAVNAELISDVPLGTFLSGGIDSPLVAYFAQLASKNTLKAYSIGSDSTVHDESKEAAWYGKHIGLQHHIQKMTAADALQVFDDVIHSLKEPLADPSLIPTFLVSKLARTELTVALSGDGGDELFYGYERFSSVIKNLPFRRFNILSQKTVYYADRIMFGSRNINDIVFAKSMSAAHRQLHSRFKEKQVLEIFPDLYEAEVPLEFDAYSYEESKDPNTMVYRMARAEFYGMMQKTLSKVDRASMANSLEVRVPFLLKSLIDTAFSIEPSLSFNVNGRKKQLLKDLLKSKLPGAPIDNRKRGFSVPLSKWIQEDLKSRFHDTLLSQSFIQKFNINKVALVKMLNDHQNDICDNKWPLLTMLVLAEWDKRKF